MRSVPRRAPWGSQADWLLRSQRHSIDGETEGWFTDDTAKRFEAYHWHVVHEIDGHDPEAAVKKRFRKRRA
ncbi:hypothetical protein [Enterobacter roggenkampii]|uniref:hypothetical protein n=1 Tax=Enterobacter roggenkampii TaxID=1812935 RepID=UPI002475BDE5|nr:hypothetical protein [Enterobacter roggenkampii]